MRAAVFVALACCLVAAVRSQEVDVVAAVQTQLNGGAADTILNQIPEENGCRANAKTFINMCTVDLVRTTSLKDDGAKLLSLISTDPLTINGGELSGFIDGATTSDACCRASCEVAKVGCMCNAQAWNEMVRAFGGTGGVNAVFGKLVGKCNTGGRSFQAVMDPASDTCKTEFIPTAKAFTC